MVLLSPCKLEALVSSVSLHRAPAVGPPHIEAEPAMCEYWDA